MSNGFPPMPSQLTPPLTEEELKKQLRQADFDTGANVKHLRLPEGLPKRK